jgi:hypothetical protein
LLSDLFAKKLPEKSGYIPCLEASALCDKISRHSALGIPGLDIHTVSGELGRHALAAGYDPRRAIERLSYGSFVSPAHRYMYMETPKVACTSCKHLVMAIEGLALDAGAAPYQRETRPDMLVHHRRHIAMPTLLSTDAQTRGAILGGAHGWMIFALVRNPFSRLVSFFDHKVRLGEPGYGLLEARYGNIAHFGGLRQTFTAFAEEVVADTELLRSDVHLMPQGDIIMPRLIPYTHIFRLEAVAETVKALRAHLGPQAGTDLSLTPGRSAGRDWRSYYEPRSAQIVANAYGGDFAQFGYDAADWRGPENAPQNSMNEEYWRGELVARNAMIDRLYDRLALPPAPGFIEKPSRKNG